MKEDLRIISLLPGGTEIVCALGLGKYMIGRSHECDFPIDVEKLPVCSRPKYRSDGPSLEINRSVKRILKKALSIYSVDVEMIKELNPTHIVTQSQCEVCAVSTDELRNALHEVIRKQDITIIDTNPSSLKDIFQNIRDIAEATNVPDAGAALVQKMKSKFEKVRNRTKLITSKPSAAHIEWIKPVMTGGHWMLSMIGWAGGRNCFPDEENRWISFDDLIRLNPDKIVIAPCGFSIDRALQDMFHFEEKEKWPTLNAVKNREIYICDGSTYFNRPGPRLTDSLEILAEIYHPDRFPPRYDNSAWIRWTGS